jgi:hypothetical protein
MIIPENGAVKLHGGPVIKLLRRHSFISHARGNVYRREPEAGRPALEK